MTTGVLGKIAESVRMRLEARKELVSTEELEFRVKASRVPLQFADQFIKSRMQAIAEVKFRSPALGMLETADAHRAVAIAKAYIEGGATAISVLTEEDHFQGSLSYLRELRAEIPGACLLMKDFVIDEYQILEARVNGADAILLIVSLLGIDQTRKFFDYATSLGLACLIEVHDEAELTQALTLNAPLIGINNRNLKTLEVSLETSRRLIKAAPPDSITRFISESGIQTKEQVQELKSIGFSGVLVGSALMTQADPNLALKMLLSGEHA